MADVKWIKLMVDMFDNRKIRYLRKLPEGNSIVLIWVMLLAMAGRCNAGGMIHLTRDIPYTPKMLADELDFEENTVVLALRALEELGMISQDPLSVTNWEEYQCTEKLEKIRDQTKKRMAEYRARQKAIAESNGDVTRNVTQDVTQCNATDIDIDIDIEEDIERDREKENNTFSLSERKKDTDTVGITKNVPPEDSEAFAVFRSFLERNYKSLSPSDRKAQEAWYREVRDAMAEYVAAHRDNGEPLTVKQAEATCGLFQNLFPRGDWIGFLRMYARKEGT